MISFSCFLTEKSELGLNPGLFSLQVSARAASLESQTNGLYSQKSELEVRVEAGDRRLRILEEQKSKDSAVNEALKKSFAEEISELKKEKVTLKAQCLILLIL